MQPHEQLLIGIATGLILCALLRWTPLWRELLAGITAAVLLHLLLSDQAPRNMDVASIASRLPDVIMHNSHFCLGLAAVAVVVLIALNTSR